MPAPATRDEREISLVSIATTVLRHRWLIVGAAIVGAVLAVLPVLSLKPLFQAHASFIPQDTQAPQTGVSGLAGQLGLAATRGNEFYLKLITSPVLLRQVSHDTLVVPEMGGRRLTLMQVLNVNRGTQAADEEEAIRKLSSLVSASMDKTDGMVTLTVTTLWRSVSLAIAQSLVEGVNDYNERTRQTQAAAERKFVEGRLSVAGSDLRAAEDRLEGFLRMNRGDVGGAPQLAFERDRLQRDVTLRQQLYSTLTQSFEDVRIREVRDTPVITVFEPPTAPLEAAPRRRVKRVFYGGIFGALAGIALSFLSGIFMKMKRTDDPDTNEFLGALHEATNDVRQRLKLLGAKSRRVSSK